MTNLSDLIQIAKIAKIHHTLKLNIFLAIEIIGGLMLGTYIRPIFGDTYIYIYI